MKERDWMLHYAPLGYRYMKTRIPFERLDRAACPSDVISYELDCLVRRMERDVEGSFKASVFTRITIYPKDVGESLNHLDPLRPRFGIEIEVRQAAASVVRT